MASDWVDGSGYTSIVGLLDTATIAAIAADVERLAELPADQRRPRDKPSNGTRHLVELDERSPAVADVVQRPELVAAVAELLGDEHVLVEAQWRSCQPGFGGQQLHADDVPKLDDGRDRVATSIVALVDFDERNGSTRVVPGSHRRPDLQRQAGRLAAHPDERQLTGPAGTAFVFSGHLLHSGTRNDGDAERPALQLVWRAGAGRGTRG